MRQYIYFKELPVGAEFSKNGNCYVKKSTRTAALPEYNNWFYFSKNELCIVGLHSRLESNYFK